METVMLAIFWKQF